MAKANPSNSISVDDIFATADDLAEEKAELQTRTKANRDLLRLLADSGQLSDEQVAEVDERYPRHTRNRNGEGADEGTAGE